MSLKSATAEAISRRVALMELAAIRAMKPHLAGGETSVSIEMKMTHVAPAVSGALRVVASHAGISGRIHRFRIHVFDESGLIGSAEHTRAVVTERRVVEMERRQAGEARALLSA